MYSAGRVMQSNIYDLQNNQSSDAYPGSSQILKTFIVMSMSIGCVIVQLIHIIYIRVSAPPVRPTTWAV
jgi:hypothetical protein